MFRSAAPVVPPRVARAAFLSSCLLALSGCGGGGGGDGFGADAVGDLGGGGSGSPGGHLIYASHEFERYLHHDVATGERTLVPEGVSYDPHPKATGETAGVTDGGDIVIRGPDGRETARFTLPVETFTATLSPDATVVAAHVEARY